MVLQVSNGGYGRLTTYFDMFVMGLLQCNKVYKHGQNELHGPPVVALISEKAPISNYTALSLMC